MKPKDKKNQKLPMFADRLRTMRESKRESQEDVADFIGISAVGYGAWERTAAEPSLYNLVRLCKHFNVSSDWLLGLDDSKQKQEFEISKCIAKLRTEAERSTTLGVSMLNQINEIELQIQNAKLKS